MEPYPSGQLVAALRRAARDLVGRRTLRDLQETLSQIVHTAVETVPGADAGGVCLIDAGRLRPAHATSPAAAALDRLQAELLEGPCLSALEEPPLDGVVVVPDLAGDDARGWPGFAPHAVEAGYRAMLSCRLVGDGEIGAVLNLYASTPGALDGEVRTAAGLFAIQAAVLLHGSVQAEHLQQAVDNRDVIGQAKGILMERFTVDDAGAFAMLVRSSQATNTKVVDVAGWLTAEAKGRAGAGDPAPGVLGPREG